MKTLLQVLASMFTCLRTPSIEEQYLARPSTPTTSKFGCKPSNGDVSEIQMRL